MPLTRFDAAEGWLPCIPGGCLCRWRAYGPAPNDLPEKNTLSPLFALRASGRCDNDKDDGGRRGARASEPFWRRNKGKEASGENTTPTTRHQVISARFFSVGNMRLRAAAVSAALLFARAKAQQVIQRYSLTNSLSYDSAMNCRGEVPSNLPKDCSGPYSGTGYVGDFVDACGTDYAVHCGMRIDSDPFAVYEDVPELSKCMEACDRFPNCTSATHLGSRCLLDANASMKAVHGHPELAALIKGSYRGMRMQTAPPSMVREYRRQASRTTVNPAAATVPVCPNSNGQLYEDDYGALYIISCGAYNTGTNYTILWSRDSGCTTLRCCMDYCDGFPDCFGTALLLGTNNNNCTFFYPPNGTHYANTAYNIAYQYRAANQPTVTYTTVSYATATQTSYLTQTTTSVGTLTSTAVSSYYTTVVNTVTTSYVQTTTQNLPGKHPQRAAQLFAAKEALLPSKNLLLPEIHGAPFKSSSTTLKAYSGIMRLTKYRDHRDLDTTGIDQYGYVHPTRKHEYSHPASTNTVTTTEQTTLPRETTTQPTTLVSTFRTTAISTERTTAISTLPASTNTLTTTERTTQTSTERTTAISTLPASTNTLTTTERTTQISTLAASTNTLTTTERTTQISTAQTTVISTRPASTNTLTTTERTTQISTAQTTIISTLPASTNTLTTTERTTQVSTLPASTNTLTTTQMTTATSTERSTATSTEKTTATSTERVTSTLPASTNTLTTTERTTQTSTERTTAISTERTTATSTERLTGTTTAVSTERITSTLPASTNTLTTTQRTTAVSTEQITSTLPASTNTETTTQRTTEQTTVISYPPASTNTATQTEVSTLLTTQNVTQTLISNLPGTTVTTTSILLSSYPFTQTETTSLLVTSTYISTYETTEVITSVQPTTIISTYPITYTSLQNITTTLSVPTLTETQRLTATNNVTATNWQTTTEQVPTYINQTTTLEGKSN
ncbi:hypothetical protein D0862_05993 [Hortaea werneckii]|uniref:Uncharacterized protein n=1 Tax=Hortaea werneckii TaxID=91943 RepID=A0A3M7GNL4_HORWE|nr:hypothetical protein D0862_05993 [Hortaea werneckii]